MKTSDYVLIKLHLIGPETEAETIISIKNFVAIRQQPLANNRQPETHYPMIATQYHRCLIGNWYVDVSAAIAAFVKKVKYHESEVSNIA